MEKTIQISGLSKSYDGKKVIENLSFSVAASKWRRQEYYNRMYPWDKESGFGNGSHFGARPVDGAKSTF